MLWKNGSVLVPERRGIFRHTRKQSSGSFLRAGVFTGAYLEMADGKECGGDSVRVLKPVVVFGTTRMLWRFLGVKTRLFYSL